MGFVFIACWCAIPGIYTGCSKSSEKARTFRRPAAAIAITKSQEEAREHRTPAEKGDAMAQFNLGVCYEKGLGVPANDAEAIGWYRKAAEQDYTPAQLNLGQLYQAGRGVEQDLPEAYKWIRLSLRREGGEEYRLREENLNQLIAKMKPEQIAEGKRRSEGFILQRKSGK
ncbi:MAG: sel1 repeat family protein [Verrucomicrobia bacterium]|nr:sel1 repeat family protein [Verrucomicrobiota bacterium]